MDEYLFQEYLDGCTKIVHETTTCFEALVFEDPGRSIVRDEREVADGELEDVFGTFDERPDGFLGGVCLM